MTTVGISAGTFALLPAAALLSACAGVQSALDPAGPHARETAVITWVLFGGAAVIFAVVMSLSAAAVFGRPRRDWLSSRALVIGGGIVCPVVVLAALLAWTLQRAGVILGDDDGPPAIRIRITGEQWWWRVQYLDAGGRIEFATANEIRVPAGEQVELLLESADVIHSFWVPRLAGKLDMIPGRVNRLRILADRPGVSRGQCAEYCGGQHAAMALDVIAQAPAEFTRWREVQRRAPAAPAAGVPARGRQVFLDAGCGACHTIRGTPAAGLRGPDLTHVGSRLRLGAGMLPNDRRTLARWIASVQDIKPGSLMPSFPDLPRQDLAAVAAYLDSLDPGAAP